MKATICNLLKEDAWSIEYETTILQNIAEEATRWTTYTSCCVFPEAGCGYHEWRAICMLQEYGWSVTHVVLMDANINPKWIDVWEQLAHECNVTLTILQSYGTLDEWMQRTTHTSLVIYINGCMLFSVYACGNSEKADTSRKSAINFWRQCNKKAVNPPVNFVDISTFKPAHSSTWEQLANTHTQQ